jgi:CheY-like chemotaxis protein/HPt (histidine-containing phosphotransfer) domain-containing protein
MPAAERPLSERSFIGTEAPVFDLNVFERAAVSLVPQEISSYLQAITERAAALLIGLREPDALIQTKDQLAEAALTLAGSAGMLGFKRLTAAGRRFERAAVSDAIEMHVLAQALIAALEDTLKEIDDRMSVTVGAGLGVALSARLAASLGGRSGHSDDPGGGSVFWMEMPLDSTAPPTPAGAARVLNVLVVDDIDMNRDVAGSFLQSAGHEATCVKSGAEAIAAVAMSDFDVVLMDVRMPGMDGLEATRRIRALAGARGRVPIVALTANTFAEEVAECLRAGMDDYLPKPFDLDMLLGAVARATSAGRQRTETAGSGSLAGSAAAPVAAAPVQDVDLPVFDREAFDRTAIFLAPEVIASYLQSIAERGEPLLRRLWGPDALKHIRFELADAAHALAGSAGMLGFERLAALGGRFKQAVQSNAEDTPAVADGLSAALEATLQEIHDRISATLGAETGLALSARLTALMAGRGRPDDEPDSASACRPPALPASVATSLSAVAPSVVPPDAGPATPGYKPDGHAAGNGPTHRDVAAEGAELPVLDAKALKQIALFLAPEVIASYLGTLATRCEALLRCLGDPDALERGADELATAAHTLAGSAGLLGFKRLAATGRSFEQAVKRGRKEAPVLAHGLRAAIEATLAEIRDRTRISVEG